MKRLTYKEAEEGIDVIFERAWVDKGKPVCVAVTDGHGDLMAFGRMDAGPMRSIAISINKAYTAVMMDRDTDEFGGMLSKHGFDLTWFGDRRFTPLPGV